MPDIIFARPRHDYGSYSDLWKLVELSQYPVVYMDEIDPQSDNCYIFSTPDNHWRDGTYHVGWPDAKARIIYLNLEWYTDVDYSAVPGLSEVWTGDKWWADTFHQRYVPIGGHAGLRPDEPAGAGEPYDVAWLAYESYRRMHARAQLTRYPLSIAPNGWGRERHNLLSRSRCMVHIHQLHMNDNDPIGTPIATVCPLRWVLAAAYSLPMVTETLADGGVFTAGYRFMGDMEYLPKLLMNWLEPANANQLRDVGQGLHQYLCTHYTFRKGIEAHV